MIKSITYGLVTLVIASLLCCNSQKSNTVTIAVSANAHFAVEQVAKEFTKKTGIETELIVGSSGKLTTQIKNGAPFDVFFSANKEYPVMLHEAKIGSKPITYSYGIPVIWSAFGELPLDCDGVLNRDFTNYKIAVANPLNAPYGQMAIQFLKNKNIHAQLEKSLVYGESISQINEYVLSKIVAIGFSAKSIVEAPKLKGTGIYCELDSNYWIEQCATLMNEKSASKQLLDFAVSKKGRQIFKEFGYALN